MITFGVTAALIWLGLLVLDSGMWLVFVAPVPTTLAAWVVSRRATTSWGRVAMTKRWLAIIVLI